MDRSLVLFLSVLFSTFLALHAVEEDNVPKKPSFVAPNIPPNPFLALYFTSPNDLENILVVSKAKKDGADESIAKYDGKWAIESPQSSAIIGDYSLVLKSEAKHHAVATKLLRPIKFDTPQLVFQYEVRFDKELDCGGAYLKLLSASSDLNLNTFNDKTPYTIMFGPDKCGLEEKLHFIIRYEHKKTGIVEEKHAKKTKAELSNYFKDKKTHLYTLVLRDDNSFEILIDQVKIQSGSLLEDMEPSITPPKEIDDPNDSKPEDWDERSTIVDETAKKPDDWDESEPMHIPDESATKPDGWLDDEPEFIPDPSATAPSDWDTEMDGEWTAPTIKNPKCENAPGCGEWTKPEMLNPKYKGKWSPPTIPNPAYKGIWEPAKIPNPDYFEDHEPYKSLTEVGAVGLELWSMTKDIVFDNFLIVDSLEAANKFADETWTVKRHAERIADPNARSVVDGISQTIKEKPWLLVLVALAAVFFMIAIYFICRSPRPTASHKKTDEPTPDDEPTDKAETPATVPEGDEDGNSTEDDIVRVSNDGSGDSDSAKLASKAELESASEDDVAQPEPKKTGAQKRRARKE